jgi:hypothetical protein
MLALSLGFDQNLAAQNGLELLVRRRRGRNPDWRATFLARAGLPGSGNAVSQADGKR